MKQMRLDKLLSEMGVGTRSQLKKDIGKGLVKVNGQVIKKAETKVDPDIDQIFYEDTLIRFEAFSYYLLYKPAGCVSARQDNLHPTVMDYLPEDARKDMFPVGRLDIDTEGLLLITNDGDLSHKLLAPGKHVPKTYYAKIDGVVTPDDIKAFSEGLDIGEDKLTLPAELEILSVDSDSSEIQVTIVEGKFHQVKRMFEAVGKKVTYLKRISMGSLTLDSSMQAGDCRKLTEQELELLKENR